MARVLKSHQVAGAGNDQIIFGSESGSDAVDGGLGNDTLALNWNTAGTTYLTVQRAVGSM